jgi:hypothetical protein
MKHALSDEQTKKEKKCIQVEKMSNYRNEKLDYLSEEIIIDEYERIIFLFVLILKSIFPFH